MPLLDVSFMTVDPMLADCFNLNRRLNIVHSNGRVMAEPDQRFENCLGVITYQDPADLIRTEDGQSIPRRIFIATKLQLIGAGPDYQPDEIEHNGCLYTMTQVFPYSRYGAGVYEGIAEYRGPIPPFQ